MLDHVPASIQGSDRDAGAIEASRANAERAGVLNDIEFTVRAMSAIEPIGAGDVITNPPYGQRVGGADAHGDVRNLYAQLGKVLRAKCAGLARGDVEQRCPLGIQHGPEIPADRAFQQRRHQSEIGADESIDLTGFDLTAICCTAERRRGCQSYPFCRILRAASACSVADNMS